MYILREKYDKEKLSYDLNSYYWRVVLTNKYSMTTIIMIVKDVIKKNLPVNCYKGSSLESFTTEGSGFFAVLSICSFEGTWRVCDDEATKVTENVKKKTENERFRQDTTFKMTYGDIKKSTVNRV